MKRKEVNIANQKFSVDVICTKRDLIEALKDLDDDDDVVIEVHDDVLTDDLYLFYVDVIDGLKDINGNEFKEIRLCPLRWEEIDKEHIK